MADLGKNGYEWSGYTEPFFVPTGVTLTSGASIGTNLVQFGAIAGSIELEYTEHRNMVLWCTAKESVTGLSFLTSFCNFDVNKELALNEGRWVLMVGATPVTVDAVVQKVDTTNTIPALEWTLTVSASVTVVAGTKYGVVGRVIDGHTILTSKTYTEGKKVLEVYPTIGT